MSDNEALREGGYADLLERGRAYAESIGIDPAGAAGALADAREALGAVAAKEAPYGRAYYDALRLVRKREDDMNYAVGYMDAARHMAALVSDQGKAMGSEPVDIVKFKKSMDGMRRDAVAIRLVEALDESGVRNTLERIQKAAFALDFIGAPLGCVFMMYKHAPYSFDLTDVLTGLRARRFLAVKPKEIGPVWSAAEMGDRITRRFPNTLARLESRMAFAVRECAAMVSLPEMGRINTALLLMRKRRDAGEPPLDIGETAMGVCEEIPHLRREPGRAYEAAEKALDFVRRARVAGFAAGYGI